MATLKELINQTADIELLLEESGGEMTPELEEKLNTLASGLNDKVDAYGLLMRRMAADIESGKKLVKDLQSNVKVKENNLKHLKEYLVATMQMHGYDRLQGTTATLALRRSEAMEIDEDTLLQPYLKKIVDFQETLPSWIKISPSVSKTELKETYGKEELPTGARMVNNTSLNIR